MGAGAPRAVPRVVTLEEIRAAVDPAALIDDVAAAFVAYSAGRAVVPPVGHLRFDAEPPAGGDDRAEYPAGDVHVKSGYVLGGDVYVVKVASGFPARALAGRSPNDGAIVVFERATGAVRAVLLDEGVLTDLRTAAAGAVAARHLAPRVTRVGVYGTGVQARLQAIFLEHVTPCRAIGVWGRRPEAAARLAAELGARGWDAAVYADPAALAESAELLVTTTARPASEPPLFPAGSARPGTHVTALGADAPGKRELDPALLARADLVVVDSRTQCADHGELRHALDAGLLPAPSGHAERPVVELGSVVAGRAPGRTHADQITVADLTGVAVQDVAAARHVAARVGRSG